VLNIVQHPIAATSHFQDCICTGDEIPAQVRDETSRKLALLGGHAQESLIASPSEVLKDIMVL